MSFYKENMIKSLCVCIILLFMSGCLGKKQPVLSEPSIIEDRLVQSSERIADYMEKLALIDQTLNPPMNLNFSDVPLELKRRVEKVEWSGPLPVITQRLADEAGYGFMILGKPPTTPVLVHVNWDKISIIDAFRDLGLRAGKRATLFVDIKLGRVEIQYAR